MAHKLYRATVARRPCYLNEILKARKRQVCPQVDVVLKTVCLPSHTVQDTGTNVHCTQGLFITQNVQHSLMCSVDI